MVMICFVAATVGLSITGFTMMFSTSPYARAASLALVITAGVVVGGLVSAQLNGGRPYGYELPVGLEQWRKAQPGAEEPARPERPPEDDPTPMV